jgi:hypothetical protein
MSEWRKAARALDVEVEAYVRRWRSLWEGTAALLRGLDLGDGYRDVDLDRLESYVRHVRLADFHRQFAEQQPYHSKPSGIVHAHPGWSMSQREERLALMQARALGLESKEPDEPGDGSNGHVEGDDAAELVAAVVDDQRGPDGTPL